jgi:uncharacterized membrane protein
MTEPPRQRQFFVPGPFRGRPRLAVGIVVGLVVGALLALLPNSLSPSTRAILAWDAGALCFIVSVMQMMGECGIAAIQARAQAEDEGRGLILGLSVVAAAASVLTIGLELSLAKDEHGWVKGLRIGLAFLTIVLSWLFVHIIFAVHYAHEYYSFDPEPDGDGQIRGGLNFPGGERPDYWDFLHFALITGVASQTADIEFTSKTQRRIGTVHGLVSFAFNTVVLALTINLMAGLF